MRVDIIHRWDSEPASLKNLQQGLKGTEVPLDIQVHTPSAVDPPGLDKIDFPGSNKILGGMKLGSLSVQLFIKYIFFKWKSDILIIHKPLKEELVEKTFGINVAERLLVRCDNVIYSTYDADSVYFPQKTKQLFKNADIVYATSKAIESEAKNFTTDEQIIYIPPSIDTEFFRPKTVPEALQSESLVLGWIGNADAHQSDLQYLADCLKDIQSGNILLRLLLGGGSLNSETRSRFEETGLELDIIQEVPWEQVPEVINSIDIGLAPLQDSEFNQGRSSEKVREYMACRVPVIGSNVGENPHLIPEDAGILVDENESWDDAVATLSDSETRIQMGKNARKHTINNYAIPEVAEQIETVINHVAD